MKAVFIESGEFTRWIADYLPDEAYAKLQQELMDHPEKGAVIPGRGGIRKVRAPDPRRGTGKRGGVRVMYLYVPEAKWFLMLDIYGKDQKEDLSAAEKRALSQLANEFKKQAGEAAKRWTRNKQ